jgi:hypothetical protein
VVGALVVEGETGLLVDPPGGDENVDLYQMHRPDPAARRRPLAIRAAG